MILIRHVDELLQRHDRDFIVAAYNALLGRDPDEAGLAFYVQRVRAGHDRVLVLAELGRSEEARLHAAQIDGLPELLARHDAERRRLLRSLRRDTTPQLNRIENLLARVQAEVGGLAPALQAWADAGGSGVRPAARSAPAARTSAAASSAPADWAALLPGPEPGVGPAALAARLGRPAPAAAEREGEGDACTC